MPLHVPRPMLATSAATLPIGPDWSYEVKWDGYRALAVKNRDRASLVSRNLKDLSREYPAVVAAVRSLEADSLILDGEIVALDEHGRPSFQALQHRVAAGPHLVYYAFDVLQLNDRDLMKEPLERRREILASFVTKSPIFLSEPLPGTAKQIELAVRRLKLEGIIAKKRTSSYWPGTRSPAWVKVKFNRRQELVIAGFKPNGTNFDSLLVGYYAGKQQLFFAGKIRAGFTPRLRVEVFGRIERDQMSRCPFVNLPNSIGRTSRWGEGITAEDMTRLCWVKPRHVAEVSFVEWTSENLLRHAQFVGLRDDKSALDVRREP